MKFFALTTGSRRWDTLDVQFWCVEDDIATRHGFSDAAQGNNTLLKLASGKELLEQFQIAFPFWEIQSIDEMHVPPGSYYPRIARPLDLGQNALFAFPQMGLYRDEVAESLGQLKSLVRRLEQICTVIEPSPSNLTAYGHAVRECILIAAMEVESHWKAVLRANGYSKKTLSTKDYIKLNVPLRLDGYEVVFSQFPRLGHFAPFVSWTVAEPSQSLEFYHTYNRIKHDRESAFEESTLKNAFESVAACVILLVAQFGMEETLRGKRSLTEFVRFSKRPSWSGKDCYCSERRSVSEIQYSFVQKSIS